MSHALRNWTRWHDSQPVPRAAGMIRRFPVRPDEAARWLRLDAAYTNELPLRPKIVRL